MSKDQTTKAAKSAVQKTVKGANKGGELSQVVLATRHVRAYDRNAGKPTNG